MQIKLNTKRIAYYACTIFIVYWVLLKKRRYTEVFENVMEAAEPKVVWEFWADFSNFQKLNPTVIDFEIEYEKGNYENWEYGVSYNEHLTNSRFMAVHIRSVYKIIPEKKIGRHTEPYRILSEHETCMMLMCLHTDAEMTFTRFTGKHSKSTTVTEKVTYECPTILAPFCRHELNSQKKLIYDNAKAVEFINLIYEFRE